MKFSSIMLQFAFRSFFSFAELHFVPVLDEKRTKKSRKSKASTHKPTRLPAGFSGLRTYTDFKNR